MAKSAVDYHGEYVRNRKSNSRYVLLIDQLLNRTLETSNHDTGWGIRWARLQ